MNGIVQDVDGLLAEIKIIHPNLQKNEPYKTHLAYVKERRDDKDGDAILAEAIEKWEGGVVTVSHDFRLLDRIANEIHICDHGMRKFDGDIMAYKKSLKKQMGL